MSFDLYDVVVCATSSLWKSILTDVVNDVINDVGDLWYTLGYMARNQIDERNIRKVSKSGNGSYYVTLPIELVREFKWKERQKVVIKKSGKKLTIEDWKK